MATTVEDETSRRQRAGKGSSRGTIRENWYHDHDHHDEHDEHGDHDEHDDVLDNMNNGWWRLP